MLALSPSTPSPANGATSVQITLLGGFAVSVDGTLTRSGGWSRRAAAALVKILALAPGHALHREQILDRLWPHEAPAQSAPRLHKAAHYARRAAGRTDGIVLRGDVVSLFPDSDVVVDALRFEQLAQAAVAGDDVVLARRALAWYGGELLPADRYEEWAADRRQLLVLRRLDVLRVAGDWRDLAELAPAEERAHVELIRRDLAAGDAVAARAQYEHLERVLAAELGMAPGPDARRLGRAAQAMAARHDGAPSATTAAGAIDAICAELAELDARRRALVAELAAAGVAPEQLRELAVAA